MPLTKSKVNPRSRYQIDEPISVQTPTAVSLPDPLFCNSNPSPSASYNSNYSSSRGALFTGGSGKDASSSSSAANESPLKRLKHLGKAIRESIRSMPWWEWLLAIAMTIFPLLVGFGIGMSLNTYAFNNTLIRPSWAPPGWLFGPVWSVLYLMMGFSSYLVWKFGGGFNSHTVEAFFNYTMSLILNFLWTPVFFGIGYSNIGVIIISALWYCVLATMVSFFRHSKVASIMLFPYLCWVSFATALNYSIVCLNGCSFDPSLRLNSTTTAMPTTTTVP